MKCANKLFLVFLLAFGVRLLAMSVYDSPHTNDDFEHFDVARSLFTDHPFTTPICGTHLTKIYSSPCPINYRPPLFSVGIAFFMFLLGESFRAAQFFNVVVGSLIVFPTFLVARHYFDEKTAILSALLIAVHPTMVLKSVQILPRELVILLVLSAIYAYIKGKNTWFGFLSGLAVLTHYTAAYFLAPLFLLRLNWKSVAIFILILSPWMARNYFVFGDPLYSTARYFPTLHSMREYSTLETPRTFGEYINDIGWAKAVGIRILNPFLAYIPAVRASNWLEFLTFYHGLGVFSPVLMFYGLKSVLRAYKTLKLRVLDVIIVFASLSSTLMYGFLKAGGAAPEALQPLIPLFAMYTVHELKGRLKLVYAIFILQALLMLYYLNINYGL